MASAAARESEARIARIIYDAGGVITNKTMDGAGHNHWSYRINGRDRDFHFACKPNSRTRGLKNTYARLRREIRETVELPPLQPPPVPEEAAPIVAPLIEPTPPKPRKITTARRKEMIKDYLSLPSLEAFMEKFGLQRQAAQTMLLSSRGQSAEKLRKELNVERAKAAKRIRDAQIADNDRKTKRRIDIRNRLIYTNCKYGLSSKDAAQVYNLPIKRIREIIKAEEMGIDAS